MEANNTTANPGLLAAPREGSNLRARAEREIREDKENTVKSQFNYILRNLANKNKLLKDTQTEIASLTERMATLEAMSLDDAFDLLSKENEMVVDRMMCGLRVSTCSGN